MEIYNFDDERRKMVGLLEKQGVIKTEEVKNAFLKVPREKFVWKGNESVAYNDSPQSLGNTNQTISAPSMVAIMLEEMKLEPGLKILEVGTGSGYNTALMAEIIRNTKKNDAKGHIISIERIKELILFATENIKQTNYSDMVSIYYGDGTLGYPEKSIEEMYDRIIVTAAAPHIPNFLLKQLKKEGLCLIPIGQPFIQNLLKISKDVNGGIINEHICNCVFVPLLGEDGNV